ncbi:MAG: DM13 domain-containing protein [Acidimicrobiales bacterium]
MTSTTPPPTLDPSGADNDSRRPGIISRFGGFLRRQWRWIVPGTAVVIAGLAWLAFGYFGVHTLFIDNKVDEDGPVFASGAVADADTVDDDAPDTAPPVTDEAPAAPDTPSDEEPAEPDTPAEEAPGDEEPADAAPPASEEPADPDPPAMEEPAEPEIVTIFEGSFTGLGRYSVEGEIVVLNDGSEQRFLRFPDLNADNGPDLNVYLSAAPADGPADALDDDFIDLGDLKGNIGSQNYEIPPDVDLERYGTVVIWCVRFSAGFGVGALTPPAA